jgi:hypothetical protein
VIVRSLLCLARHRGRVFGFEAAGDGHEALGKNDAVFLLGGDHRMFDFQTRDVGIFRYPVGVKNAEPIKIA